MRSGRLWGKKEAHCDVDDKDQGLGDCWDHDIIDVASRAVIVRVHGPRTAETVQSAMLELKERLAPGHVPGLVTTDEYSPYVEALLTVFGTPEQLAERLESSPASSHVNTAFIERANGGDRHRNPRKARKVLSFSKQGAEHRAVSWLVMVLGIFCWVPRTLRQTSAMILGKATHVLTIGEFLHLRPQGFRPPTAKNIRAGHTPFHAPDVLPGRLALWPDKRLVQRSFQHLGVNARGLG